MQQKPHIYQISCILTNMGKAKKTSNLTKGIQMNRNLTEKQANALRKKIDKMRLKGYSWLAIHKHLGIK